MSKTKENLEAAFAGESMARNKYTFFAKVARKEGYNYIAKIFEETAENELQHAKEHYKLLHGLGDTKTNLKDAMEGERYETTQMYPNFLKDAEAEGEKEAIRIFKTVGKVESHHEARYQKLLEMVEKGTVYKREKPIRWKCSKCGHIHVGVEPPGKCPCCFHEKEYFEPECMCFEEGCDICGC